MKDEADNSTMLNPMASHMRHRALVFPDGLVSLVADTPGITIEVAGPRSTQATEINLSPEEFLDLNTRSASEDKYLTYDHARRKFSIRSRRD